MQREVALFRRKILALLNPGPMAQDHDLARLLPQNTQSSIDSSALPFVLHEGDEIVGCSGLSYVSDPVAAELRPLPRLWPADIRVITIASADRLERRASLCLQHFTAAARQFPQIKSDRSGVA